MTVRTIGVDARNDIDRLVDAVQTNPKRLPLGELAELSKRSLVIDVDCGRSSPVVYVSSAPSEVFTRLSPRETEVVALLAGGFSNDQIASALFVSVATVKGHVHMIFGKTGLVSRTQVVAAWYGGLAAEPDQTGT